MRELRLDIKRYNTSFFSILDGNFLKYNLTGKQMMVLSFLGRRTEAGERDINQQEVEKAFSVRRSSVTSILKKLEKTGYIERAPHSGDTRRKIIRLSREGTAVFERGKCFMSGLDESFKAVFTLHELKRLKQLFKKLAEAAEKLQTEYASNT